MVWKKSRTYSLREQGENLLPETQWPDLILPAALRHGIVVGDGAQRFDLGSVGLTQLLDGSAQRGRIRLLCRRPSAELRVALRVGVGNGLLSRRAELQR